MALKAAPEEPTPPFPVDPAEDCPRDWWYNGLCLQPEE